MRPEPEFDRDLALRMYQGRATIQAIADAQPGWKRDKMRVRLIREGIHTPGKREGVRKVVANQHGKGHTRGEYVAAFRLGLSDQEIAAGFGVSLQTVDRHRLYSGMRTQRPPRNGSRPKLDEDAVLELTRLKRSSREIATQLRADSRTVQRARQRLRAAGKLPPAKIQILEPGKLEAAARMLDDGVPFAEISRTLRMSMRTLRSHFPGRQWTRAQVSEHARASLALKQRIKQVWPES